MESGEKKLKKKKKKGKKLFLFFSSRSHFSPFSSLLDLDLISSVSFHIPWPIRLRFSTIVFFLIGIGSTDSPI